MGIMNDKFDVGSMCRYYSPIIEGCLINISLCR